MTDIIDTVLSIWTNWRIPIIITSVVLLATILLDPFRKSRLFYFLAVPVYFMASILIGVLL